MATSPTTLCSWALAGVAGRTTIAAPARAVAAKRRRRRVIDLAFISPPYGFRPSAADGSTGGGWTGRGVRPWLRWREGAEEPAVERNEAARISAPKVRKPGEERIVALPDRQGEVEQRSPAPFAAGARAPKRRRQPRAAGGSARRRPLG